MKTESKKVEKASATNLSPVQKGTQKSITGTGEWASHNYNIQPGCRASCAYCSEWHEKRGAKP